LSENIEDHGCSINRSSPKKPLEVALLSGRQIVVEYHRVNVKDKTLLVKLFSLS